MKIFSRLCFLSAGLINATNQLNNLNNHRHSSKLTIPVSRRHQSSFCFVPTTSHQTRIRKSKNDNNYHNHKTSFSILNNQNKNNPPMNSSSSSSSKSESISTAAASAAVEFARLCGKLKTTKRTGWVYRKIPNAESVADHSWRVAVLCLLLLNNNNNNGNNDNLDVSKCMEMAIVHDLAESIVGDIAPSDNVLPQDKRRMEEEAVQKIANILKLAAAGSGDGKGKGGGGAEKRLLTIFHEYEERKTKEAIVVKDLDLLDMICQAMEYVIQYPHVDLTEFFDGTPPERFRTDLLRNVAIEIHRQRDDCVTSANKNNKNREGGSSSSSSSSSTVEENRTTMQEGKKKSSSLLSENDADFVQSFLASSSSSPSNISQTDIEAVVIALRKYDDANKEK